MDRGVRRIGQRRAVFGEGTQISLQRLRVDGDGAGAGAKLCGAGGIGIFPAEHKISAILTQRRPAAGPVGSGDGGDLDVSRVNVVAAGADAAALRRVQNRLRPMKSRRERELIGEIHGLCDVLTVGRGRIRVSVQLDVPDEVTRGSGRAVRGGGDAGGCRAVQELGKRVWIALGFPEGVDLFARCADARLICRLSGCQDLAPDGKAAARAAGRGIHGCHGEAQRIADAGNELQTHGVRVLRRVAVHGVVIKGIYLAGGDVQNAVCRAFLEIHAVDIFGVSLRVARGRRDGHGVARQERIAAGSVAIRLPLERFALGGDLDLKIGLVVLFYNEIRVAVHVVLVHSAAAGGAGQAGVVKDAIALCRVGERGRSLIHGRFAIHAGKGRAVGKTVRGDRRDGGRIFKSDARQRLRKAERVRAHGSDRAGHAVFRGDGFRDGHACDVPRNIDQPCRTCGSVVGIHHALRVHIHRAAEAGERRGSIRKRALGNRDLIVRLKNDGGRVVHKVGEALGERIHLIADSQREGGVRAAGVRRGGVEGSACRVVAQSLQPHHGAVGQVRRKSCHAVGDLKVRHIRPVPLHQSAQHQRPVSRQMILQQLT